MKRSNKSRIARAFGMAAAFFMAPQIWAAEIQPPAAQAQGQTPASGFNDIQEIAPDGVENSKSPVKVRVGIPMWMSSISGDVGVRGQVATMNTIEFGQILERLDYVIPGSVGVEYKKWTFLTEGQFVKLSDTVSPEGPVFTSGNLEMEQAFIDVNVGYKVVETEDFTLAPFIGTRIEYVSLDLQFNTPLPGLSLNRSGDNAWADPILGLGFSYRPIKPLALMAKADVGGFGAASHLTYQALAGVEVQITRNFHGSLAYRYLSTDYSSDGFTYDVNYGGPQISFGFHF
jgi:opacity protein-like surface antigen